MNAAAFVAVVAVWVSILFAAGTSPTPSLRVPRMKSVLGWARRMGLPVDVLRAELEAAGKPLWRVRNRLLAREEDIVALLDKLRASTRAEDTARVDIAMDLVEHRLGLKRTPRKMRTPTVAR